MSCNFPKNFRLLKRFQYQKLNREGRKFVGNFLYVYFRLSHDTHPKLGITVSSKFGNAVLRNGFKRKVREAFRHCHGLLPQNLELNVSPKIKAHLPSTDELKKELLSIRISER
jgi:ribonuclease P protein component